MSLVCRMTSFCGVPICASLLPSDDIPSGAPPSLPPAPLLPPVPVAGLSLPHAPAPSARPATSAATQDKEEVRPKIVRGLDMLDSLFRRWGGPAPPSCAL